jgi:hypothetical protein
MGSITNLLQVSLELGNPAISAAGTPQCKKGYVEGGGSPAKRF